MNPTMYYRIDYTLFSETRGLFSSYLIGFTLDKLQSYVEEYGEDWVPIVVCVKEYSDDEYVFLDPVSLEPIEFEPEEERRGEWYALVRDNDTGSVSHDSGMDYTAEEFMDDFDGAYTTLSVYVKWEGTDEWVEYKPTSLDDAP